MARPRKPAAVLKQAGAFDRNPARERVDVPGTGVFNKEPPARLHQNYHAAWRHIVERLPQIMLTASDEPIVAQAARILGKMWEHEQHLETILRLHTPLMNVLEKLAMTPASRTRFGISGAELGKKNPYEALHGDE